MKFKSSINFLFSVSILLSVSSFGQSTINLLNGKQIKVDSVKKVGDRFVYYKPLKLKPKSIKKDDIFSINYPDGVEDFIFLPDTANGDINIYQMQFMIRGEQDRSEERRRERV